MLFYLFATLENKNFYNVTFLSQVTRFVFKLWNPVDILNAKLFSRMPSAYSFHSKGCFSCSSIFSLKYHQRSENIAHNEISPHSIYNGYYKKGQTNCWQECAQRGWSPTHCQRGLQLTVVTGKTLWKFLTGFKTDLTWSTTPIPTCANHRKWNVKRDLCIPGFISALFQKSQHTDLE